MDTRIKENATSEAIRQMQRCRDDASLMRRAINDNDILRYGKDKMSLSLQDKKKFDGYVMACLDYHKLRGEQASIASDSSFHLIDAENIYQFFEEKGFNKEKLTHYLISDLLETYAAYRFGESDYIAKTASSNREMDRDTAILNQFNDTTFLQKDLEGKSKESIESKIKEYLDQHQTEPWWCIEFLARLKKVPATLESLETISAEVNKIVNNPEVQRVLEENKTNAKWCIEFLKKLNDLHQQNLNNATELAQEVIKEICDQVTLDRSEQEGVSQKYQALCVMLEYVDLDEDVANVFKNIKEECGPREYPFKIPSKTILKLGDLQNKLRICNPEISKNIQELLLVVVAVELNKKIKKIQDAANIDKNDICYRQKCTAALVIVKHVNTRMNSSDLEALLQYRMILQCIESSLDDAPLNDTKVKLFIKAAEQINLDPVSLPGCALRLLLIGAVLALPYIVIGVTVGLYAVLIDKNLKTANESSFAIQFLNNLITTPINQYLNSNKDTILQDLYSELSASSKDSDKLPENANVPVPVLEKGEVSEEGTEGYAYVRRITTL